MNAWENPWFPADFPVNQSIVTWGIHFRLMMKSCNGAGQALKAGKQQTLMKIPWFHRPDRSMFLLQCCLSVCYTVT